MTNFLESSYTRMHSGRFCTNRNIFLTLISRIAKTPTLRKMEKKVNIGLDAQKEPK